MKKYISLFLSLTMAISTVSPCLANSNQDIAISSAVDKNNSFSYKDTIYNITKEAKNGIDGTVSIVSCNVQDENFVIPEKVYLNGLCYIVEKIEPFAFSQNSSIKTISIPKTITQISSLAFASCENLSSISVAQGSSFASVDGVLFDKAKTSLLAYPMAKQLDTYTLPNTVKTIEKGAFYENKYLKHLKANTSLQTISSYAFAKTKSLVDITDAIKLKSIQDYTFSNSSIKSISLSADLQTLGEGAFYCSQITSTNIPYQIGTLPKYCFYGCKSLRNIYLEKGLYYIDDFAFANSSLELFEAPSSLSSIGKQAFASCQNLKNISFNQNLEKIDDKAFANCQNLEKVAFGENLKTLGQNVFEDCKNLSYINTDDSLYFVYEDFKLFDLKREELIYISPKIETSEISLPDTLSRIRSEALINIPTISEFKLSDKNGYFSVEDGILYDKNKTKIIRYPSQKPAINFNLPTTVKEICPYAFKDAKNFEGIMPIDKIEKIDATSFINTPNLSGFYLENGENTNFSILDNVLYNKNKTSILKYPANKKQDSFTLPSTVTTIGSYAFENTSISKIDLANATTINSNAFLDANVNTVSLPKVSTIKESAFNGSSLNSIDLSNTVKTVGDYSFANCKNLNKVNITSPNLAITNTAFENSPKINVSVPTTSYAYYKTIFNK